MFPENLVLKSSERILQLKNKHKGARIFCLGNGPSLKKTDLALLKNEIVIGSNHVNKVFVDYGFFPQYCCVTDRKRILELRGDKLLTKSTVILADHMSLQPDASFFTQEEKTNYIILSQKPRKIYYPFSPFLPLLAYIYHALAPIYYALTPKRQREPQSIIDRQEQLIRSFFGERISFSFNINEGVNLGTSVIFTTIQVAAYMGASEIYLLGVDADYSQDKYCFTTDESKFYTNSKFMNDPLGAMNPFFEIFKRDLSMKNVKLYNATIGGRLDSLERKDFYSLF